MFFKTATVACSLAALLMIGCDTANDEPEDSDVIVAPDDAGSPDTPAPGTTGDDLEPTTPTTPPVSPNDTAPAPDTDLPETDESDADEPVVEEVEADSLPEEE